MHNIKHSLNPAFTTLKPQLIEIEQFSRHALELINSIAIDESEEFHKNCLSDFLKTLYLENYINTNQRNDLVIHNDKTANSSVAVIIETKKPSNKAEMLALDNLNKKALQQLLFYYLCERVNHNNLQLKYLIATNNDDWFIFDAQLFERLFYNDKNLIKQFKDFQQKASSGNTTDFFYKNIAQPAIAQVQTAFEYTYFKLSDYKTALENCDKSIILLFKFLSPQHLLKQAFVNDGNSLNKEFYNELLHIIGLTEVSEKGKKLIKRKIASERDSGSLLEKAIAEIISLDKLSRISQLKHYGNNREEQLFNIALELCITWINRVLFLRLLEAQLLVYHNNNQDYSFLNNDKLKSFADVNDLFFKVLATQQRSENLTQRFAHVPYLNSSLFEQTPLEHETIVISQLGHHELLPLLANTVLKDELGKKYKGKQDTLVYLLAFLNAYDFASDDTKAVREDNKQLINAAVLGLIFEKINGYQDGSFFTPSFITMTMSRESLRRAVLQKFNEIKQWNCQNFDELYNKIDNIIEANNIINSLKICDPAVGSGHFLVSVLNEIIAIKSELKILCDRQGKRLKEYSISIINDELEIRNEEDELFFYKPTSKESQRVQETLFHEKQTIIEQCLFGVDINANSVAICRLRLWIELLKNAYYLNDNSKRLETLPNIDINIKCGNSLMSRFALDVDLKTLLAKHKVSIEAYKKAFHDYQNAQNKEEKRALEQFIEGLKNNFIKGLHDDSAEKKTLNSLIAKRDSLNQVSVFEETLKDKKEREKQLKKLELDINKASELLSNLESTLYEKSFEWRFEFPEALSDDVDFIGFDVIIGNPPYIFARNSEAKGLTPHNKKYFTDNFNLAKYQLNLYALFIEKGYFLTKKTGVFCYITPNNWLTINTNKDLRAFVLAQADIKIINFYAKVFENASVDSSIILFSKQGENKEVELFEYNDSLELINHSPADYFLSKKDYIINIESFKNKQSLNLLDKIEALSIELGQIANVKAGLKAYEVGKGNPVQTELEKNNRLYHAKEKINASYIKYLDGKDVCRYQINWSGEFLNYGKNLAAPRGDFDLFSTKRILVRQIPAKPPYCIHACLIKETALNDLNSMNILNFKESAEFILAILNSRLISYWFVHKFGKMQRGIFPQFKINELASFPIPKLSKKEQQPFIKLVNKILANKKAGKETSKLEQQIDKLVYTLYGLEPEEISIIEGK